MMSTLDASRWRRRPTLLVLAALLALVWLYALRIQPRAPPAVHPLPPQSLTQNLEHLRKHVKTARFSYAQRMIRTKHFKGERPDLTAVDNQPLFPGPETLDATGNTFDNAGGPLISRAAIPPQLAPLDLYVPESPQVNTSIISFGVSTPVGRLKEATNQFVHWLAGSGAPMHVISPPDDNTAAMESHMRDLGMDITIETSKIRYPLAYFTLIKRLYENRHPHTQWVALIDDDTFLPSLPTLIEHLSTTYRAEREVMVSAMSDNIEQIETWGMQAFGGGGIFISVPLAARLTQPKIWDECLENAKGRSQGDQIITRCLYTFTDVRPTFDPNLHQMDMMGPAETPSGYFESGRRMFTVHHWRSWFRVDIPKASQVSKACGTEGLFQRWSFPKSNLILSNAYSIAEYSRDLDEIDFAAVEKTWEGEEANFLHKIGPLRKPVGPDKISYRLVESGVVEEAFVRQTYLHREKKIVDDDNPGMDKVLELLWLL